MDTREALRILNLIGVTSRSQTELRYLQLRARIEMLIGQADSEELKQTYRETAQSLEEAYQLLIRNKGSKLLGTGSVVGKKWREDERGSGESAEMLTRMKASIAEVQQLRTYLQQYSAMLEVQLAKAEEVIRDAETHNKAFDDAAAVVTELRTTAEQNVQEIATHLEDAKQLAFELRKRKSELADIARVQSGKSGFLGVITGRGRQVAPPYDER